MTTELKVSVTDIPAISALLPQDTGRLAVILPAGGSGLTNTELRAAPVVVSFSAGATGLTNTELRATAVPVSGPFYQATQPVSGAFYQATQPVSGPLTDAQLRFAAVPVSGVFFQATQPVSGAFFQATQPVSATALPLPAGAATQATLATLATDVGLSSVWTRLADGTQHTIVDSLPAGLATGALQTAGNASLSSLDTKTPAVGQALMAASRPVVLASNQSALAVTGTFWQATQPVSGTFWQATQPISVTTLPLPAGASTESTLAAVSGKLPATIGQKVLATSVAVAIASDQSVIPVSGTFWQATQPISVATLPLPAGAATSALQGTLNALFPATLGQKAMAASLAVVVASDQSSLPITAPTLTKGTQAATGLSVQNLKDAGRVLKTYTVSGLVANTVEALISLTPYADLVAGAANTTFAVTAGKRLRIQSICITVKCTSTVNVGGMIRLRLLAGAVLVTSPVHNSLGCQGSNLAVAVIGNAQSFMLDFPDGLELSGTMQLGLTQLFSAATATLDVHITAYEY